MKHTNRIFYNHNRHGMLHTVVLVLALCAPCGADAAAVAQRGTANAASANRVGASRANTSVAAANKAISTNTAAATAAPTPVAETPAPAPVMTTTSAPDTTPDDFIIEDKSYQFDTVLDKQSTSSLDAGASQLADMIRAQRAALDAQDAVATATAAVASGQNACDGGLRQCMKQTCGNDFTKCAGDTDTTWGMKMDKCRRDLNCTGEEYKLFAAEIKSDRDINAQLASFTAIINCGNEYNNCIVTECGTTFSKCLGKSAGDSAIAKCEKIAKNCTQQDSGLAARVMTVFGDLRVDAEKQVVVDEKRLAELRKQMENKCSLLGATLDTRTMDCVYTVSFYAGTYDTPYASKKLYAGSTFDCTQDWFGINATTFKENAYRLTRDQQSASSAMMGAGVGVAAGAITSGAINRAIDTTKAKNALKKAQKEAGKTDAETAVSTESTGANNSSAANNTGNNTNTQNNKSSNSQGGGKNNASDMDVRRANPGSSETTTTDKNGNKTITYESTTKDKGITTVTTIQDKEIKQADGTMKRQAGAIKTEASFDTKRVNAGDIKIKGPTDKDKNKNK